MVRIPLPRRGRYLGPTAHGPAAIGRIADEVRAKLQTELRVWGIQFDNALRRESHARREWQGRATHAFGRHKREIDALAGHFRTLNEALRCAEDELFAQGLLSPGYIQRFRGIIDSDQGSPRIPRGRTGEAGDPGEAQAA